MARRRISPFNAASLLVGFAFLYLPIVILLIYSFNASRLVTVWGGWSLRWYGEFFNDRAMIDAAWMSLRVAAASATIATLLGALAAIALSRGERFSGRTLFSGMLYAPLVMPEVITGLSLLLLFVAIDAERGFWTVTIAHTTLTMCFVAVVVQSRLISLDKSLEEAAMDLGCDPARAFLAATLPLIIPAIAAGWMLAFTLSLDDLVIASFTTGPGSATLPIRIYSEVRLGVKPEINAICTLAIVVIAAVIVVASLAAKLSGGRGRVLRRCRPRLRQPHRDPHSSSCSAKAGHPVRRGVAALSPFSGILGRPIKSGDDTGVGSVTTSPRPRSGRRPCSA